MKSLVLTLHDQAIELHFPEDLQQQIDLLFGPQAPAEVRPSRALSVWSSGPGRFSIGGDTLYHSSNLTMAQLLEALLEAVGGSLIEKLDTGIALHAASIGWGDSAIVIAGPTGSGKTSLAAQLVANGFEFLSDELTVLPEPGEAIVSFPRPLLAKADSADLIRQLTRGGSRRAVRTAANVMICGDERSGAARQPRKPALIVFPHFAAGAELELFHLSPARASLKLMECNLNARNLSDHGLRMLAEFARKVPAIGVNYGRYQQLNRVADLLVKFSVRPADLQKLVSAFAPQHKGPEGETLASEPVALPAEPSAEALETAASEPKADTVKLTIGMATHDDYDGVYFTVQAVRMFHPEILDAVEFLVIDNNPTGSCAQALKDLENWIPNYRYVPKTSILGTAVRDEVFREARGRFVLCVDCHVLIEAGGLRRLMEYFDENPGTGDLLQGPLIYDDLKSYSTHFKPGWQAGMYGMWASDPAGAKADQPPFEIPMQGLGLFACRRSAWPGFNPAFRGFGGEEGYIHEKFRQRGGKTLCLPFVRWLHRFNRPMGVPYTNVWDDRIRNYLIGFRELGWDTGQVIDHFRTLLGEEGWARVVDRLEPGVLSPAAAAGADGGFAAAREPSAAAAPSKAASWLGGEERSWLKTASAQFGAKTVARARVH